MTEGIETKRLYDRIMMKAYRAKNKEIINARARKSYHENQGKEKRLARKHRQNEREKLSA
ncbi:MAG: hypothetical protein ACYSTS_19700 [Planctomycetota bacterium]|jgi:hypothetical protein